MGKEYEGWLPATQDVMNPLPVNLDSPHIPVDNPPTFFLARSASLMCLGQGFISVAMVLQQV
jgi:hypothetical protein